MDQTLDTSRPPSARSEPAKTRQPYDDLTLSGRVYRRVLADILHGHLQPGRRLSLLPLAASYGTSSATLREALIRLTSDRLVDRDPQRGFRITPATHDELLELVKAAGWLGEIGLRESMARGDRLWEERVLSTHRALSLSSAPSGPQHDKELSNWDEHVLAFHEALVSACHSSILVEQCHSLQRRVLRYRNLATSVCAHDPHERDDLLRIRNATLERNADLAVDLLHSYYRSSAQKVFASGVLS